MIIICIYIYIYVCVGYMGKYTDTYIWHIWKLGNFPANTIQIERERVHRVFQASDSLFEFVYIWFYLIILIVKQSTHFDFENESSLMLILKVICVRTPALLCCSHGSIFGYSLSLSICLMEAQLDKMMPTNRPWQEPVARAFASLIPD